MNASLPGLIFYVLFFAIGVYLYLFARGIIRFGNEETRARAEEFRSENATWMRLIGLLVAAIMGANAFFEIRAMLG